MKPILTALCALGAAACATTNSGPAQLASAPSQADRAAIAQAVYNAMGQRNLSFDAADLQSGQMLVKPLASSVGPQRVMGVPERFSLVMGAGGCALVQDTTGIGQPLPTLACQAVQYQP